MTDSPLQAAIRSYLARTGESERALSLRAGLNEKAVNQMLAGKMRSSRGDTLTKLAAAMGMTLLDLVEGKPAAGTAELAPTPNARPAPEAPIPVLTEMKRDVPVFGSARGANGDGAFVLDTSEVVDWVRRPPGLVGVRDVYALWVEGESMEPAISHGDLVYLHPRRPIHPGDRVVLVMREGLQDQAVTMRAYVKEFVRRAGGKIITRQFNPAKEVEFPADTVVSMHKVLTMADLMGV